MRKEDSISILGLNHSQKLDELNLSNQMLWQPHLHLLGVPCHHGNSGDESAKVSQYALLASQFSWARLLFVLLVASNTFSPYLAISASRATRYSWGRSPLMRLQLEHSSCRFSRWSVPPRKRGTRWSTSNSLNGKGALAAFAEALLLAEQDVLVLAVGNGRLCPCGAGCRCGR